MQHMTSVSGKSLGYAYQSALHHYNNGMPGRQMVITCLEPIGEIDDQNRGNLIDQWEEVLNLGEYFDWFCSYEFDRESSLVGGSTGRDWIDDRIIELHEGVYAERLENPNQIAMITDRLKDRMHGSSTNALVAQVFGDKDLERACVSQPNNSGMACITELQFHPIRDKLHLHQILRSQYIDLKGYGNLIAAATLLSKVCSETGYAPGSIFEHVNNVTDYRERHVEALASYE